MLRKATVYAHLVQVDHADPVNETHQLTLIVHSRSATSIEVEALLLTGRIAVRWMVRKADMPTQKLTAEIIAAAIDGYEFQKTRIDTKIAELRAMLSGGPAPPVTLEPKKRKRRKMSAAGRARIAEAQRKRWAKIRGESEPSARPEPPKPKRRISKAGMAENHRRNQGAVGKGQSRQGGQAKSRPES